MGRRAWGAHVFLQLVSIHVQSLCRFRDLPAIMPTGCKALEKREQRQVDVCVHQHSQCVIRTALLLPLGNAITTPRLSLLYLLTYTHYAVPGTVGLVHHLALMAFRSCPFITLLGTNEASMPSSALVFPQRSSVSQASHDRR